MTARMALAVVVLLAGCAEEPEARRPGTPSPTPVPGVSPSPVPAPSPTPETACTDASLTGSVEVRIVARDFAFDPACLIVLGGQGLVIRNAGTNLHNFTVERSPIGIDVAPGQVVRTEAVGGAVPPGSYAFYCIYHRGQGMTGELTVSAAG